MSRKAALRLAIFFLTTFVALTGFMFIVKTTPHAAAADQRTLFVAPDGSGSACIQAQPCALQTALVQAQDGDTIYLAQGTYTGTGAAVITVNKSIALYGGWDGSPTGPVVRDPEAHPTVLDGEDERQVIYLAGGSRHPITVTLSGLTVVHGNGSHAAFEPGYGGGIFGFYATPIITGNVIAYNVASTDDRQGIGGGIAIKVSPGPARIEANRVFSNVASLRSTGAGGGIRLVNAPGARIINNVVMSNTAAISATRGYGGGMAIVGHSENTLVQGNRVAFNVALRQGNGTRGSQGYGGGIDVTSDAVTLSHNEIFSNTAVITGGTGSGGGIAVMGADHVVLESNQAAHNLAQQDAVRIPSNRGGGIYCFSSDDILIRGNTVRYNTTSVSNTGSGGGIYLSSCQQAVIQDNLIEGNRASVHGSGYGGGFHAYASRGLLVEANQVVGNIASDAPWGKGGGLYFSRRTVFTMTNNIVAQNHASKQGGGVAFETSATEPVRGALVHNTFVANNQGDGDGRIAIHVNEPYVTLALTNTLIVSHTYGIYVHSGSTATLHNTLFYANSEGDVGGPGAITNINPITGQNPLLGTDYHLQGGSPAIDAGANVPWVATDIDGDPRPWGPAPDIGADEYVGGLYKLWLPVMSR